MMITSMMKIDSLDPSIVCARVIVINSLDLGDGLVDRRGLHRERFLWDHLSEDWTIVVHVLREGRDQTSRECFR